MKVWGSHTKGMDHLQRRAMQHIGGASAPKASRASQMEPLSQAEQRKALYEQRFQNKFHTNRAPHKGGR